MKRKRPSQRGPLPVALLAVVITASVALAWDFTMTERNAQLANAGVLLAQGETTPAATTQAQQPSTPEGTTSQEVCLNDRYLTVTIGTTEGSKPTIKTENGTYTKTTNPPEKGCYARFCTARTPTTENTATELCTGYRYYQSESEMQSVNDAAAGNNTTATNLLATNVVKDAELSGVPADAYTGLPSNVSGAIGQAFSSAQTDLAGDVTIAQNNYQLALERFNNCTTDANCEAWRTQASEQQAIFDAERTKLERLQSHTESLGSQFGQYIPSPGSCGSEACASGATPGLGGSGGADPRYQQSSTIGSGGQQTQPPPVQRCEWWQIFCSNGGGNGNGGGNLLGALLGGGQQQQQCGYVNGRYVCMPQQQCNALQQMISGCPNMFGQQQCGGLALMMNRCPAGSYNPNNPSNPYNYPQPTCTIQVSPQSAASGQAVTLQWQSQNAQYANLSSMGQVGPNGSTTVYPQGPTTYVMNVVGYGNQQGQCQAQFGSGSGTSGEPKAQISCQPLKADIGMQISLSYSCENAATSVGSGFTTGGALSGSATVTVGAPSLGQHTVNYGVTCSNQGKTHSAQCTIDINKAAIVLVANPKTVKSGEEANIGWVTSGMQSCVIASSNAAFTAANASSTSVSGAAKTPALTQDETFTLTCETKTGATKAASTSVQVLD